MQNIFWYIFYGVLSTFLVHPWYIKGLLKGKTVFKNYEDYYGFSFKQKIFLYIATVIELILLFYTINTAYISGESIIIPYVAEEIVSIMVVFQGINFLIFFIGKESFEKYLLLFIIVYYLILLALSYNSLPFRRNQIKESIPNFMEYENTESFTEFIPVKYISKEYEKDNFKYLFKNSTDSSKITILNTENNTYTEINLNENLSGNTSIIRKLYPNFHIEYVGITITNENKVYKTYAIFDIKAFCYTPTFSNLILKDCNSDEIINVEIVEYYVLRD